jgi:addiction module HigA family antidote
MAGAEEERTMPMLNPSHPGALLRDQCLKPLGLTVTATAKALGVSRQVLSEIVNERAGISPDMAIRIAKAFDSDAAFWVRLQASYGLAQARRRQKQISRQVKTLYDKAA